MGNSISCACTFGQYPGPHAERQHRSQETRVAVALLIFPKKVLDYIAVDNTSVRIELHLCERAEDDLINLLRKLVLDDVLRSTHPC